MKYKLIHNNKNVIAVFKENDFVNCNNDVIFVGTEEEIIDEVNKNNISCYFSLSASFQ